MEVTVKQPWVAKSWTQLKQQGSTVMTLSTLYTPANTCAYKKHTIKGTGTGIWPEGVMSQWGKGEKERVCNLRQVGNGSWLGSQRSQRKQVFFKYKIYNHSGMHVPPSNVVERLLHGRLDSQLQHPSLGDFEFVVGAKPHLSSMVVD